LCFRQRIIHDTPQASIPIIIVIGFLLVVFSVQNSQATTLDEVVETAKSNNRTIKMEDYKLKATETLKKEALGDFLPNVKASAQYGSKKLR
jgi:outer membrane protein TolC